MPKKEGTFNIAPATIKVNGYVKVWHLLHSQILAFGIDGES